jgi:hypothetical protein
LTPLRGEFEGGEAGSLKGETDLATVLKGLVDRAT